MRIVRIIVATIALALCAASGVRRVSTVTLQAHRDASVNSQATTTSYGTDTTNYFGNSAFSFLIQFDASALGDVNIDEATLALTLDTTLAWTSGPAYLCQLTQYSWTEACTYNKYDATNDWTTPGGDYTLVGAVAVAVPATGSLIVSNRTFVAQVQDAIDNHGGIVNLILVLPTSLSQPFVAFVTKENAAPGSRPTLALTYTPLEQVGSDATPPEIPTPPSTTLISSEAIPTTPSNIVASDATPE